MTEENPFDGMKEFPEHPMLPGGAAIVDEMVKHVVHHTGFSEEALQDLRESVNDVQSSMLLDDNHVRDAGTAWFRISGIEALCGKHEEIVAIEWIHNDMGNYLKNVLPENFDGQITALEYEDICDFVDYVLRFKTPHGESVAKKVKLGILSACRELKQNNAVRHSEPRSKSYNFELFAKDGRTLMCTTGFSCHITAREAAERNSENFSDFSHLVVSERIDRVVTRTVESLCRKEGGKASEWVAHQPSLTLPAPEIAEMECE